MVKSQQQEIWGALRRRRTLFCFLCLCGLSLSFVSEWVLVPVAAAMSVLPLLAAEILCGLLTRAAVVEATSHSGFSFTSSTRRWISLSRSSNAGLSQANGGKASFSPGRVRGRNLSARRSSHTSEGPKRGLVGCSSLAALALTCSRRVLDLDQTNVHFPAAISLNPICGRGLNSHPAHGSQVRTALQGPTGG